MAVLHLQKNDLEDEGNFFFPFWGRTVRECPSGELPQTVILLTAIFMSHKLGRQ